MTKNGLSPDVFPNFPILKPVIVKIGKIGNRENRAGHSPKKKIVAKNFSLVGLYCVFLHYFKD